MDINIKDPLVLAALPQSFDRLGLTEFYDSLDSCGHATNRLAEVWDRLTIEYQALASFLMLGSPISKEVVSNSIISPVISLLEPTGLLNCEGDAVSLSGLVLERYRGVWFFADAPSFSPTLYYGYDSIGLARRLQPLCGGKALDLCSGPGIQALILSQCGMNATAVDINPIASDLCRLNAAINGVQKMMNIVSGNLYEAIDVKSSYDLIVANPPLLPIPNGVPYPFIGDGGPDGCDLTVEIIAGARGHLASSGSLMVIGMTTYSNGEVMSFKRLEEALASADLEGALNVIATYETHQESRWVEGLAGTSLKHNPAKYSDEIEAISHISNGYTAIGADRVCTFVLRAWPSVSLKEPCLHVQDFSGDGEGQNPWRL